MNLLKPFLEIAFVTFLYIVLGFFFCQSDPLLFSSKVYFLPILLTLVTLFHGTRGGLFSLLLLGISSYFLYENFPSQKLLSALVLVLILGQFFHYWLKRLKVAEAKQDYMESRLKELNDSFYALKVSHDTLEKSYALKPKSLRSSLRAIEDIYLKGENAYRGFLKLICDTYHVEGALIAKKDRKFFSTIAKCKTAMNEIDFDNPLVKEALKRGQTSFISKDDSEDKKYLSVIVTKDKNNQVDAIMVIEKMPFLEFNENNIIAISILFSYFIDRVKLLEFVKNRDEKNIDDNQIFSYHEENLRKLNKNYSIDSSVIVFKVNSELKLQRLKDSISSALRSLDSFKIDKNSGMYNLVLLLPLTPDVVAKEVIKKLNIDIEKEGIKYMIFDISKQDLILEYIRENSNA